MWRKPVDSASYTHLPVHVFYLLACKPFKSPQPVLAGYTADRYRRFIVEHPTVNPALAWWKTRSTWRSKAAGKCDSA
ncbi:hypothetical protein [Pantoea allii]|uniref:hypothetical protein n=1 Tax=Pantoea allii TaxID=574096 RepID=UPI003D316777